MFQKIIRRSAWLLYRSSSSLSWLHLVAKFFLYMAQNKEQDALKAELKMLLKRPENARCADCNTQGMSSSASHPPSHTYLEKLSFKIFLRHQLIVERPLHDFSIIFTSFSIRPFTPPYCDLLPETILFPVSMIIILMLKLT